MADHRVFALQKRLGDLSGQLFVDDCILPAADESRPTQYDADLAVETLSDTLRFLNAVQLWARSLSENRKESQRLLRRFEILADSLTANLSAAKASLLAGEINAAYWHGREGLRVLRQREPDLETLQKWLDVESGERIATKQARVAIVPGRAVKRTRRKKYSDAEWIKLTEKVKTAWARKPRPTRDAIAEELEAAKGTVSEILVELGYAKPRKKPMEKTTGRNRPVKREDLNVLEGGGDLGSNKTGISQDLLLEGKHAHEDWLDETDSRIDSDLVDRENQLASLIADQLDDEKSDRVSPDFR